MNNNEINYEKLLDDWAELVYEKSDKAEKLYEEAEQLSWKEGYCKGYSEGLIMALSLLNLAERRYKRNKERR